jgi:hypothetical protein
VGEIRAHSWACVLFIGCCFAEGPAAGEGGHRIMDAEEEAWDYDGDSTADTPPRADGEEQAQGDGSGSAAVARAETVTRRAKALHSFNVSTGALDGDLSFAAGDIVVELSDEPGMGWATGTVHSWAYADGDAWHEYAPDTVAMLEERHAAAIADAGAMRQQPPLLKLPVGPVAHVVDIVQMRWSAAREEVADGVAAQPLYLGGGASQVQPIRRTSRRGTFPVNFVASLGEDGAHGLRGREVLRHAVIRPQADPGGGGGGLKRWDARSGRWVLREPAGSSAHLQRQQLQKAQLAARMATLQATAASMAKILGSEETAEDMVIDLQVQAMLLPDTEDEAWHSDAPLVLHGRRTDSALPTRVLVAEGSGGLAGLLFTSWKDMDGRRARAKEMYEEAKRTSKLAGAAERDDAILQTHVEWTGDHHFSVLWTGPDGRHHSGPSGSTRRALVVNLLGRALSMLQGFRRGGVAVPGWHVLGFHPEAFESRHATPSTTTKTKSAPVLTLGERQQPRESRHTVRLRGALHDAVVAEARALLAEAERELAVLERERTALGVHIAGGTAKRAFNRSGMGGGSTSSTRDNELPRGGGAAVRGGASSDPPRGDTESIDANVEALLEQLETGKAALRSGEHWTRELAELQLHYAELLLAQGRKQDARTACVQGLANACGLEVELSADTKLPTGVVRPVRSVVQAVAHGRPPPPCSMDDAITLGLQFLLPATGPMASEDGHTMLLQKVSRAYEAAAAKRTETTSKANAYFDVVCPAGVEVGQTLHITLPNKRAVMAKVPVGVIPGQTFRVLEPPSDSKVDSYDDNPAKKEAGSPLKDESMEGTAPAPGDTAPATQDAMYVNGLPANSVEDVRELLHNELRREKRLRDRDQNQSEGNLHDEPTEGDVHDAEIQSRVLLTFKGMLTWSNTRCGWELPPAFAALRDVCEGVTMSPTVMEWQTSLTKGTRGLGIEVDQGPNEARITTVQRKTPAADAGLRCGDDIVQLSIAHRGVWNASTLSEGSSIRGCWSEPSLPRSGTRTLVSELVAEVAGAAAAAVKVEEEKSTKASVDLPQPLQPTNQPPALDARAEPLSKALQRIRGPREKKPVRQDEGYTVDSGIGETVELIVRRKIAVQSESARDHSDDDTAMVGGQVISREQALQTALADTRTHGGRAAPASPKLRINSAAFIPERAHEATSTVEQQTEQLRTQLLRLGHAGLIDEGMPVEPVVVSMWGYCYYDSGRWELPVEADVLCRACAAAHDKGVWSVTLRAGLKGLGLWVGTGTTAPVRCAFQPLVRSIDVSQGLSQGTPSKAVGAVVLGIADGLPAHIMGLRENDLVLRCDGNPVRSVQQVRSLQMRLNSLRGPEGSASGLGATLTLTMCSRVCYDEEQGKWLPPPDLLLLQNTRQEEERERRALLLRSLTTLEDGETWTALQRQRESASPGVRRRFKAIGAYAKTLQGGEWTKDRVTDARWSSVAAAAATPQTAESQRHSRKARTRGPSARRRAEREAARMALQVGDTVELHSLTSAMRQHLNGARGTVVGLAGEELKLQSANLIPVPSLQPDPLVDGLVGELVEVVGLSGSATNHRLNGRRATLISGPQTAHGTEDQEEYRIRLQATSTGGGETTHRVAAAALRRVCTLAPGDLAEIVGLGDTDGERFNGAIANVLSQSGASTGHWTVRVGDGRYTVEFDSDKKRKRKRLRATNLRRVEALTVGHTARIHSLSNDNGGANLNGRLGTVVAFDPEQRLFTIALAAASQLAGTATDPSAQDSRQTCSVPPENVQREGSASLRVRTQQHAGDCVEIFGVQGIHGARGELVAFDPDQKKPYAVLLQEGEGEALKVTSAGSKIVHVGVEQLRRVATLEVGDVVRVRGLTSVTGQIINGAYGTVQSYDELRGRYVVAVAGAGKVGGTHALLAANLQRMASLTVGDHAEVHSWRGGQARGAASATLNGMEVKVVDYDASDGHYLVRVASQGRDAPLHRVPKSNLRTLLRDNLARRVQTLFDEVDTDKSGTLSEVEILGKLRADTELQAILAVVGRSDQDVFGQLDVDEDGVITREEFARLAEPQDLSEPGARGLELRSGHAWYVFNEPLSANVAQGGPSVRLSALASGKEVQRSSHSRQVYGCALSADALPPAIGMVLSCTSDGAVHVRDLSSPNTSFALRAHSGAVYGCAGFSLHGGRSERRDKSKSGFQGALSCGKDGLLRMWDLSAAKAAYNAAVSQGKRGPAAAHAATQAACMGALVSIGSASLSLRKQEQVGATVNEDAGPVRGCAVLDSLAASCHENGSIMTSETSPIRAMNDGMRPVLTVNDGMSCDHTM